MLKKLLAAIAALALLFCPLALALDEETGTEQAADSGLYEGKYNYSLNAQGEARIDHYYADTARLDVPGELNGHPVAALGEASFSIHLSLEAIRLPESVREIGGHAFEGCLALQELVLPEGLVSTGTGAFMNCIALEELDLPESLRVLGESSFHGCKGLVRVTLPEGLEEIGRYGFEFCTHLREIHIPASVTSIGEYCFFGCEALERVYVVPGSCAEAYCRENGLPAVEEPAA